MQFTIRLIPILTPLSFHKTVPLTLFYTLSLGKVVLHVMVPQPYRFPFDFLQRYGNLTILKFCFKWVKVMLPYTGGVGKTSFNPEQRRHQRCNHYILGYTDAVQLQRRSTAAVMITASL